MSDLPADGVQFYAGTIPPAGTYADIADGKEYSCLAAALCILAATILAAVLIAAAAA